MNPDRARALGLLPERIGKKELERYKAGSINDKQPLQAKPCRCESPWADGDQCVRCGRQLP